MKPDLDHSGNIIGKLKTPQSTNFCNQRIVVIALTAHHVNMYCAWSLVKEMRVWPPIGPPIDEVIDILVSKNI